MNKYLVIIGLSLDVGIIFFSLAENHFNVGGIIIGFLFLIIDLTDLTIKFYKNNKFEFMKKRNDKLLNNVDKAEKKLEKFYTDYSEYKIEEIEK